MYGLLQMKLPFSILAKQTLFFKIWNSDLSLLVMTGLELTDCSSLTPLDGVVPTSLHSICILCVCNSSLLLIKQSCKCSSSLSSDSESNYCPFRYAILWIM